MAGLITSVAVSSAMITDGSIVNADINASAAIDATKIADGSVTSTEFQYINTLSSNAQTQITANRGILSMVETGAGTALGVGVVILDYGTEILDPSNRITTGAAWKYTAAVNCTIRLTGTSRFTTAARRLDLFIDGVHTYVLNEASVVDTSSSISCTFNLNAASYFDLRAAAGSASALYGDIKFNFLTIEEFPR